MRYLLASSQVYGPVVANPAAFKAAYDAHMAMLTLGREVARFTPSPGQPGPELIVVEVR